MLPWSLGWCSVPLVRPLLPKEVGLTFLPGVGANPRLRRDRAAPAGCKASGCSQVDVEFDLFHIAFKHACLQLTVIVWCLMCCTVVARLLHQLAQIHAGLGMARHTGVVHDDSRVMLLGDSSGTIAYGNLCVERGHGDHNRTQPLSTSTWSTAWRPAVGELAFL